MTHMDLTSTILIPSTEQTFAQRVKPLQPRTSCRAPRAASRAAAELLRLGPARKAQNRRLVCLNPMTAFG